MDFLTAKTAAAAAMAGVRLPATQLQPTNLAANARRPQPAPAGSQRGRYRSEQARYKAQCRVVMSF